MKKVVIFDIDLTLSDNRHRDHLVPADHNETENWNDWNRFALFDTPIIPMCNLASSMIECSVLNVLFLTGRCEDGRVETIEWLRQNVHPEISNTDLIMREHHDNRHHSEIKLEVCYGLLHYDWEIVSIFEDCKTTVDILVSLGLPAVKVEPHLLLLEQSEVSRTSITSYKPRQESLQ